MNERIRASPLWDHPGSGGLHKCQDEQEEFASLKVWPTSHQEFVNYVESYEAPKGISRGNQKGKSTRSRRGGEKSLTEETFPAKEALQDCEVQRKRSARGNEARKRSPEGGGERRFKKPGGKRGG